MPAQWFLISRLALFVLLGTVRAGPFSPRSNVTLPAPRPPPQPGGRTVEPIGGSPSSQLYEHTVEGGEKQVVFTHRINLPPSAGCGCPPGTEPPVPASEVQALKVRLEILEELVKGLKEQCTGGCCPAAAQAGTGQTDVRSLCSLHGVFDLSRCACSCEPGWGGPTCSDPTGAGVSPSSPPSASASCPDDCNDQGRCVRGRCVCFPGYSGPSCGWPSCPGDCNGRGRCVQGVCVCRAGFSGDDCSQRSCPRGCSQRGRCEDGRCVCDPGYTGDDCGKRSCPRGCSQRGRCENGRCVCDPGYSGEDCGLRSCPRGCSQRGRCENGRCVCDPGYAGDDCGSRSCAWDCGEGGRCVDGRCVCWPGYAGEDCSTRTCPRDCRGRGRCEDGECICDSGYSGDDCGVRSCPGDCNQRGRCEDGRCVCWPGYTGPDCGSRACPRDCRGRGRCENGVCVCNAGYSGEDCGVRSCPGDCRGRGRCENGRCVCWPGYTGRDCGTRACPGDCRGRGRCVDGRCVCNPGYAGEDCGSRRCPGDCRGRGRCEDGVCVCNAGYEGEDCGVRSCPGGCHGRGQCLDGRCVCDDGYSGEDCSVRLCPRDCNQHGVCQDGVCTCWEGYAGEDCGLRTCPSNCHQRGRCEDGRCVCDSGYTGPSCATRTCPADCRGRGRCVQGVCVCHVGYSGEDCGQEEPPASACPGGCGPRELCRGGQCVCVEGFRGPDCAIQTCPRDCLGRGECREGSCVCQDGYAGEDCGEEVPAIEGMRMHLLEETTVRTEWTRAPGTVDAYEIQFIPTTEGVSPPFTARVPSSASAYDQRGLAPGQEYQVMVRALRGTSWGPPASKTITTMIDGPQDLRVVAVTPTTLELSWLRPQAEVDRFVVSYVSAGNQRVRLEVPSEADGTVLTDLMPGVEYVVTVTAERGRAVSYPASVRANTGSSPSGLLGATDEPPPSGPSTTQGARAPELQQRPQELGELRVLGRDKTGKLRVTWTAQPDTFAHFQLRLRMPEGPGAHEELLPGDVRQALVPSPPPGVPYELSLRGVPPEGEPSAPLIYQGIMDREGVKPGKPLAPPHLGELTATDMTSSTLVLRWTVPEGEFDSFVIQYKDRDGPQVAPVEGSQRSALITNLDLGRKYRFVLYGLLGKKRHGPLVAEAKILPQSDPSPATPPRLGKLWVTDPTPDSLHLSWTVPEGQFDSFVVQYKDREGQPQVMPVEGPERSVIVSSLDPNHKYRFTLFGIADKKRHGPLTADGTTASERRVESLHPESPERPLLGELLVAQANPDSLRLSWTVTQGSFDSFVVQYKDAQGQSQAVPVRGDENEVTIPGLESHRKYKMNLYGLHGRQRLGPVSVVATTAHQEVVEETPSPTEPSTEAPEPPEEPLLGELTVTGSSPDSLSLSWTVPQGHFDAFTVQYKDGDGRPQVVRVRGDESEVTIGGLEPGRKYKMHLYGLHRGQREGPVSAVAVTAPQPEETPATEPPLEPRLGELTVTDVTPNSVGLAWTVPEGQFDSFMVQYKDRDGQPQVVPVAADQREVTIAGLEPARKHKMNFYGLHDGQRVGPLSVVAVTAPLPPAPATESPQEPRLGELTATDLTPDSVTLSWTVPEGEFDSFVVQYKDRDGQPRVVPVPTDQRGVTIPGLEPSRKYKFLLYGLQDGKRRSPVSVEAKTAAQGDASLGAPPRLGELWVTDPTLDSLRLSWTVPEGHFDSFVVQFKDRDGPRVVPVEGHERSVTVTPLDTGHKYRFLLYGLLGKKRHGPLTAEGTTESWSGVHGAITKQPPKPRLGEELQVTSVTPDSVSLAWTVPEGQFDSFVVQYKDRDGQPQVVPVEGSLREVSVSGLDPARRYKLLLYGLHQGKRVGPISAIALTAPREPVKAEAPSPPGPEPRLGEVTVEEATPDTLHLSWTETEGDFDSFEVHYTDQGGQLQVLRIDGDRNDVILSGLESEHRYLVNLYGFHGQQRVGPAHIEALTVPREEEDEPSEPPIKPRLGELAVTDTTPDSLHLSWTVPEGQFDHFLVQYKNGDGQPKAVRVPGYEDGVTVSGLQPDHKYKMNLYGFHGGQRVGPVSAIGVTGRDPKPHRGGGGEPTERQHRGPRAPRSPSWGADGHGILPRLAEPPDASQGHFDAFTVQYKDGDGGAAGPVSAVAVTEYEAMTTEAPSTVAPEPPIKPRLGELAVTDATPDSLHLSWTVPEGQFDHFLVQYKNGDGQPKAVRVPGYEDGVTVSGLQPDHKYKMNLYGFHGGQRVGPVSAIGVTASEEETPSPTEVEETPSPTEPSTEAPEPPEEPLLGELTVTGSSPDSLSLSWTVPQGHFDAFTVQYKDGDGRPQVVRVRGDESEVTIGGLEPGRKYKMHLYGLHMGQRKGPVSAVAVTMTGEWGRSLQAGLDPEGEPPTNTLPKPHLGELTVTDATPDSLHLSWTVPEGQFDHFLVQYKNGDGQPKVVRVPGNEDQVTISGLEPGRKYKMNLYGFHGGQRVGPVSAVGLTGKDHEMSVPTDPPTTTPQPPIKPQLGELAVTDATPDSLHLSWTVPEGQFDHFLVQYKNGDGQPKAVRVPGYEDGVTVSGLQPDHKYKMNLYGFHGGQRVGPVSAIGVTTSEEETPSPTEVEETPSPTEPSTEAPEPPEEPLLGELTVMGSSPDSLSLSWTVPQGHFDAFTVQYKDGDGRPQVVRVRGDESEVTIGGLEPGRKYKLHLYGLHRGQRKGPVSAVAVTAPRTWWKRRPAHRPNTEAPEPRGAPPGEAQFDHFLVQYKNGDRQPKAVARPGYEDGVTVSGLQPDHKYKMNLYGFHGGQRVGPVSAIGVTASEEETPSPTEVEETPSPTEPSTEAPEPPEEPLLGELTVTGSSPDSLSLSWTVPQGHFDAFTVQYKDGDGRPQVVRVTGDESEVTIGGLEPGHKYRMNLYGLHRGQRKGPVSAVAVTASLPTEPPVAPRLGELAVATVTSDTVSLSWTVAQGLFDSFLVQYKDVQGQAQAVPVDGHLREITISGLDPARKYKFLLFGLRDEKHHGPMSAEAKTLSATKGPHLGELTVTDLTPDSVSLSWTVPEGEFDSFVVQYKDRDGQPRVVPVAADQRRVTIPGLEPRRKYKFLLYGLAGRKRLGPISADGTTAPLEKEQQRPPRLGELTVTDETSDSLRLSWTVAQGVFDSFVVQYRDPAGQPQAVPVAKDQREVTIEGLEPGRKYKFLLYGIHGGQRLGPISVLGATAPAVDTPAPWRPATEAPEPPAGPQLRTLAVSDITPDSLRLSWSVAQGPFDSFVVQYQDTDGQPQALLVGGNQNKVRVSGLEPSTSYRFFLYGLHEGKRLGPVSADGTTGPAPAGLTPGEPGPRLSQLSVTDVTTSSLRLNWEAPPEAFDSFLLRFGVPSPSTLEPHPRPPQQRELTVPGSRRSAVLRDLHPGTLYSLTLYGLRGPHKADSIQGTARTLSPVLESPRDLQFSEIGETSAQVSWMPPPSRVDSFKVSYQLADGGEPQSVQVDGRTWTQRLKGLIPGSHYEVTVVSVRGFEESEPLTGFLTTVPDGPTQLRALNLTEGSALLHWKPPQAPVDKYNVRVTASGAPPLQGSAPGSAVEYPLSGLELHTNYTATVRGLRGPNLTSPASITFTTGLEAPQDLEAKEVTPRTALLTWTEPQVPPTNYLLSFNTPGEQTQEILLPGRVTSHRLLGLFPSTPYSVWLRAMWGESLTPPVSTSFTTGGLPIPFPRDCGEEIQNGASTSRATTVFLNGNRERPLNVFCDMETDGGGWLVFQRRMDGQTDFWRDWEDYAHGFGNISGEFWLGNEALHSLTAAGDYSLRVDLRAGDEAVFAQYDSFRVDSAAEYYRLHLAGYHGTAGDSMSYHSGSVFSARDRDPNNLLISCAVSYRGAWWYKNCHYANLNGLYGSTVDHQGVSWYYWKGFEFSVPFTEMKLRPRSYRPPAAQGG
ncbi:tenascin-X [Ursus maritimus]|uniref:Tenascin-X n=1 Tax=Ursus maritimus TaxID=29073 RepID=A0A8M1H0C7_URSMA|nr:tenascin-X [Ursus maritimus]